ncbi:hypothetical protein BsWGS_06236 [Bradybaena similaris]
MLASVILLTVAVCTAHSQARRYRTCDQGCCLHEYCAYHRICYPRIHCSLGCPDGQCVGQDHQAAEPVPPRQITPSRQLQTSSDLHQASAADLLPRRSSLTERYSYRDAPDPPRLSPSKDKGGTIDKTHTNHQAATSDGSPASEEVTNGICMPLKPCQQGDLCELGHSCTFNYNLGYAVCQYNLDIGSTLCYDNKGNPILQSLS